MTFTDLLCSVSVLNTASFIGSFVMVKLLLKHVKMFLPTYTPYSAARVVQNLACYNYAVSFSHCVACLHKRDSGNRIMVAGGRL
jgi:hypothetical protein